MLTTLGVEHGIAYYVSGGSWAPRQRSGRRSVVARRRRADSARWPACWRGWRSRPRSAGSPWPSARWRPLALPFALAWFYGSFVALADDHYEGYVLPPALQSVALLVLALALALPFGIAGAVVALLVSHALAAAVTYVWGRRRPKRRRPDRAGQLRRALAFGVKGYAANALQVLNYRVDFFVLSAVATTAALGHYAVAVAVTTVLWLLPQALGDVLFPRVAALSARRRGGAPRRSSRPRACATRRSSCWSPAVGVALALLLLVVPIYGPDFERVDRARADPAARRGADRASAARCRRRSSGAAIPSTALYTALIVTPVTLALYVAADPRATTPPAPRWRPRCRSPSASCSRCSSTGARPATACSACCCRRARSSTTTGRCSRRSAPGRRACAR